MCPPRQLTAPGIDVAAKNCNTRLAVAFSVVLGVDLACDLTVLVPKPATQRGCRLILDKFLLPRLGTLRLSEITLRCACATEGVARGRSRSRPQRYRSSPPCRAGLDGVRPHDLSHYSRIRLIPGRPIHGYRELASLQPVA